MIHWNNGNYRENNSTTTQNMRRLPRISPKWLVNKRQRCKLRGDWPTLTGVLCGKTLIGLESATRDVTRTLIGWLKATDVRHCGSYQAVEQADSDAGELCIPVAKTDSSGCSSKNFDLIELVE